MPHNESYVLVSYVLTFVAMIIIIGWVVLDSRARQSELKKLEASGIRRRSAEKTSASSIQGKAS